MMIPHIIHYCWFGRNPKPELLIKCINSWRKYLPDWEIIEWNEDNFDVNAIAYSRDAYNNSMWAFVSDYARFKVLYDIGGLYFDTDVELLKPIPEDILTHIAFTGVESNKLVNPGLIFACEPHFSLVKDILDSYNSAVFNPDRLKTVNEFTTYTLQKYGYHVDGSYQEVSNIAIYESEVFCGYDQDIEEIKITDRTISVHHYASSWRKRGVKFKLQKILKRIIGIEIYRKILYMKRCCVIRRRNK